MFNNNHCYPNYPNYPYVPPIRSNPIKINYLNVDTNFPQNFPPNPPNSPNPDVDCSYIYGQQLQAIPSYNPYSNLKIDDSKDKHYKTTQGDVSVNIQPDNKKVVGEKILNDSEKGFEFYPYNTRCESKITSINLNVNNTTIHLSKNMISSDKNILIDVKDNCLCVWTTVFSENRKLTTNGSSVVDGYRMLDFEGKNVKVDNEFKFISWNLNNVYLDNLIIKGNNNIVNVDSDLYNDNKNVNYKIYGKNTVNFSKYDYDSVNIFSTYSSINFDNSNMDSIHIEMEGNGQIDNLFVQKSLNVKLVGEGKISVNKDSKCKVFEEIFGGGQIYYKN